MCLTFDAPVWSPLMAVANHFDIRTLGQHFAAAIRDFNAPVHEIWIRESQGIFNIWIITRTVELDEERSVYHVAARLMDEFPERDLDFRVVNPNNLGEGSDPHDLLPQGVERVAIPAA